MMRKLDWANGLLYAIFTGITLALVLVFVKFLAERTEVVSLILLVMGAIGACAILLYIIIRWYLSHRLKSKIFDQIKQIKNEIEKRPDSESGNPVRWYDLQKIFHETKTLAISLFGYGRAILAVLAFMAVTIELLALANAAVMYLQAKRLQEQNVLLDTQNRIQLSGFLTDSLNINQIATNHMGDVRKSIEFIETDLLFNLDSLDDLVTKETKGEVQEVKMINFEPIVCSEPCDSISLDLLMTIVEVGPIRVTEENEESIRGYAKLARAADMTLTFLLAWERDKSLDDAISSIEAKINLAATSCGRTDLLDRVIGLWKGITYLGRVARSTSFSYLSSNLIDSNSEIEITPDDVRFFTATIKTIARSLSEDSTISIGPKATAMLFARGLQTFRQDFVSLLDACEKYQVDLAETIALLSKERARALREAQSEIEGAVLRAPEAGNE